MGFPKGFRFARAIEPLETVHLPAMNVHLLAHGDGVEVLQQDLNEHAIIGMRPEDGWTALEVLYVLKGRLRVQGDGAVLGAGDSLTAHPIEEPLLVEALEPCSVLYVASQPVFHLYSDNIQDLFKLATEVEAKDGYTRDHCRRIQKMSVALGTTLGLSGQEMYGLTYGSFLHDVGKARVPEDILGKPGPLTDDEWTVMRAHVERGADMVGEVPYLRSAARIIHQHHERLDGSGYPLGRRGADILMEARIVAVTDTYDAMTTARPYRDTPGPAMARKTLLRERGVTLDPDVVDAFLVLLESHQGL